MKNLFLLPTDKPSRLFKVSGELKLTRNFDFYNGSEYQNIYITNDEEIKEGDWVFGMDGIFQYKGKVNLPDVELPKKIIITTDQDLIKDGVQAIDDEFLEWFVKNPSCEEIKVNKLYYGALSGFADAGYKIIIPKEEEPKPIHKFNSGLGATLCNECYVIISEGLTEELFCEKCKPKQETLEEAAENYSKITLNRNGLMSDKQVNGFIAGAKYQAERMYSEEDMLKFAWFLIENVGQYSCDRTAHFEGKYLEQFKKKA